MKHFKLLALIALLLVPSVVMAEESTSTVLVVELQDGDVHCYEAKKKPIITFNNDAVIVTTGTSSFEYAKNVFSRMFFKKQEIETGINDVVANYHRPSITFRYIDDETIEVLTELKGLLRMYNLNGQLVATKNVTNGTAFISLSEIPSGIYLLNINNQTIKFCKR